MQNIQMELVQLWYKAGDVLATASERSRDDRGEVTAQTALIVVLVTGAIAAGLLINAVLTDNVNAIPDP